MIQLDTETATVNLTTDPTVLTYTVPTLDDTQVMLVVVDVGTDGNPLDGVGGDVLRVTFNIGGSQYSPAKEVTIEAGTTKIRLAIFLQVAEADDVVTIKVDSSNSNDTAVAVTAHIYRQFELLPDPGQFLVNNMVPQDLVDILDEVDLIPRANSRVFRFNRTDANPDNSDVIDRAVEEVP